MHKNVRQMVLLSLLIALSVALSHFMSFRFSVAGVEGVRLGLGGLPMIFAGIAFGPVAGGIVGALSDIIGYLLYPMGGYMPHFTFTAFLTGFIPGLLMKHMFKQSHLWMYIVAIAIGEIITSVILVPYFLQQFFGISWVVSLVPRLVALAIQAPFYASVVRFILTFSPVNMLIRKAQQ